MPVFISYRHTERLYAFILSERLKLEGIDTHLELFDAQAQQTTDDVCGTFLDNLGECTHLIAVLGDNAGDAWWLPFGLGAAAALNRRITLYESGANTPEYLQKWPLLTCHEHIDLFVRAFHDEQTFCRAITGDRRVDQGTAEFFHADLKAKIRRGF